MLVKISEPQPNYNEHFIYLNLEPVELVSELATASELFKQFGEEIKLKVKLKTLSHCIAEASSTS